MILVAGATGQLGSAITRLLLAHGWPVRILIRLDSPAEALAAHGLATSPYALIDAGAEPIFGDLKDRDSLDAACEGVSIVVTTANSASRGDGDTPETVDLIGNRNLIDAAVAADVRQFVFTSAMGADAHSPVPFLAAKGQTEQYLQASGLPYTILAPNAFMESWIAMLVGMPAMEGHPVVLYGEGRRLHSFVSLHDVAAFAVAVLGHPAAINQRLVIGGPRPFSLRDAVAVYEQALDHPIPVRSVAPGEPLPGVPPAAWPLAASFELFDSPNDMHELERTFGVTLTPIETVVQEMMGRVALHV